MKTKKAILTLLLAIILQPVFSWGGDELIEVFYCEVNSYQTPYIPFENTENDENLFTLYVYKIGKKLGEVKLLNFDKIHASSREDDGRDSPLMGSGLDLVFKIKNNNKQTVWYHVFYEDHKNNPIMLRGKRFKIIELRNINCSSNPLFIVGQGGGGQSYNTHVLEAMRELLKKNDSTSTPKD